MSSDSDDQLHSYAAQIDYYTKLVGANPDWELVDIYADEASTGTQMEKRDDLNRMLADCKKGKIDKVLIKAIHRLARNTADCLRIIRDLKLMGVSVRSERERLDTENMDNEMLVMLWANMGRENRHPSARTCAGAIKSGCGPESLSPAKRRMDLTSLMGKRWNPMPVKLKSCAGFLAVISAV